MARQGFGKPGQGAVNILLPVQMPVGTRVLLTGDHPWAGEAGEIIAYQKLSMFLDEPARPRIRMQNGEECFATDPARHLKRI